jgi:hypothetical protein
VNDYNLNRLPYGAEVFKAEVAERYPDATFEYDNRDGLGIYRALKIEFEHEDDCAQLGEVLVPIMESSDPRIVGWVCEEPDRLTVVFTDTDEAEDTDPFHLDQVANLLATIEENRKKPEATKPRPARKKAAKKST